MAECVSEEFKCENWRAVFNRADGLKRHVDKNRCEIQCNLCDKTLKCTEYLEKHIESTHRVQMNLVKTKEGHIELFQSTELQNNLKCTQCDVVATYHEGVHHTQKPRKEAWFYQKRGKGGALQIEKSQSTTVQF